MQSDYRVPDFLYGNSDGSELDPATAEIAKYEELGEWTSKQWASLLERYANPPLRAAWILRLKRET